MAAAPPAPGSLNASAVNIFGLHQYDGQTTFFDGPFLLPEAAGWTVVILFGFVFAVMAVFLVWVDVAFSGVVYNSEQFNTAGRSIGAGLLAVDIVSHWTWASILLQAVTYGFLYGVSGSYWFVSGSLCVWIFAVISLELKYKAPTAHTMLEVVEVRWGKAAHIVFFCFGVLTNLLVSISMLQGCVAVVNALCGVNLYAMAYIIPISTMAYAAVGGLKATFTTSYMHTVIIYVVCLVFMFKVFVRGDLLGGIDDVYERLRQMAIYYPAQQRDGSYMTIFSESGLQLEWIFFLSGMAQMTVDQSYWQTAVAAKPSAVAKGYFLATFLYLAIVFTLPVCLGVAALALDLPLSTNEALSGLVMPASAFVLLGKSGGVLVIIITFMAVTSSGASEMVAISSLFTFDIYRKYINPRALGPRMALVSRIMVVVWALVMGTAMCVVQAANININWLINCIGIFAGGAVPPLLCVLTWRRATGRAAIPAAIIGSCCGFASWMAYAKIAYGEISIDTTGMNPPLLTGNIVSEGISWIILITLSLLFPDKQQFDWELLKERIHVVEDTVTRPGDLKPAQASADTQAELDQIAAMRHGVWIATFVGFLIAIIAWPLLMMPAGGVWSLGYFRFYVVITFIMIFIATIIGTFLPLWEGRHIFIKVLTGDRFHEMVSSIRGGRKNSAALDGSVRNGKGGDPKLAGSAAPPFPDDSAKNGTAASKLLPP